LSKVANLGYNSYNLTPHYEDKIIWNYCTINDLDCRWCITNREPSQIFLSFTYNEYYYVLFYFGGYVTKPEHADLMDLIVSSISVNEDYKPVAPNPSPSPT